MWLQYIIRNSNAALYSNWKRRRFQFGNLEWSVRTWSRPTYDYAAEMYRNTKLENESILWRMNLTNFAHTLVSCLSSPSQIILIMASSSHIPCSSVGECLTPQKVSVIITPKTPSLPLQVLKWSHKWVKVHIFGKSFVTNIKLLTLPKGCIHQLCGMAAWTRSSQETFGV